MTFIFSKKILGEIFYCNLIERRGSKLVSRKQNVWGCLQNTIDPFSKQRNICVNSRVLCFAAA